MTNQEDGNDRTESAAPQPPETQTLQDKTAVAGIPKRIGQYRIKRAIASGGMGTVYEAIQEKPRRTVALKLMRAGIASRSALRRFEYESQLLARLRHPGIAQVYDAGTHKDGEVTVPYFAMEYIVGAKAVTDYAKEKKLGTRERMKLFSEVCEAVHHGHQKGIIHRDLLLKRQWVDRTKHSQEVRNQHLHQARTFADEIGRPFFTQTFVDRSFDESYETLWVTTHACLIEWLTRGCTVPL